MLSGVLSADEGACLLDFRGLPYFGDNLVKFSQAFSFNARDEVPHSVGDKDLCDVFDLPNSFSHTVFGSPFYKGKDVCLYSAFRHVAHRLLLMDKSLK